MATEAPTKPFVVQHEFDHEPTYICRETQSDEDEGVTIHPDIPWQTRLPLARNIAFLLNSGLTIGWPIIVERHYGDYEHGGEQSTPSYVEVMYFASEQGRDQAMAIVKPLVDKLEDIIGDEVNVWDGDEGDHPRLVKPETIRSAPFEREWLKDMAEGAGENWDEIVAKLDQEVP